MEPKRYGHTAQSFRCTTCGCVFASTVIGNDETCPSCAGNAVSVDILAGAAVALSAENERLRSAVAHYGEVERAEQCASCGHAKDDHPYQSGETCVPGCGCTCFASFDFDEVQQLRTALTAARAERDAANAKVEGLRKYADAWRAADRECRQLAVAGDWVRWDTAASTRSDADENCAGAICALFPED